jgi:hypothetical protein
VIVTAAQIRCFRGEMAGIPLAHRVPVLVVFRLLEVVVEQLQVEVQAQRMLVLVPERLVI